MTPTLLTKLNKTVLYKYLFYKHFYKFIFLHKPLCKRYKESTLKIFNFYICRSCLFLYIGFLSALIFCIYFIKTVKFGTTFFIGFSILIVTLLISHPLIYSKFNRKIKDFIRFFNGVFLASGFYISFKISIFTGIASIFIFIYIRNFFNKKRSGERICQNCIKLNSKKTCSGYFKQKKALLNIDEEYAHIIMKQWRNYD